MKGTAMPERFALGTFSVAGSPAFAGVVVDDLVVAATALQPFCEELGRPLSHPETVFGLLQAWERNFPVLQACMAGLRHAEARAVEWVEVDALTTHAPVLYPRQIFCAGANYRRSLSDDPVAPGGGWETAHLPAPEHRAFAARPLDRRTAADTPYLFSKIPSAITGPYDPIILPIDAAQPDGELELGVIIGRPARRVRRAEALDYVAGYTIVNDVTNRDKVQRADIEAFGSDWLAGKCAPSFLPMGPYLVPATFVPDPQQIPMTLTLNGQVIQDADTSDMLFDVARLIEYTSGLVQLWPGDLICTGSPWGTDPHHNRFLRPGDLLEGTIGGLGMIRNTCVRELAPVSIGGTNAVSNPE